MEEIRLVDKIMISFQIDKAWFEVVKPKTRIKRLSGVLRGSVRELNELIERE